MNKIYFWLLLLCMASCKDRYNPPAVSVNSSYLVVEGYLNGSGTTTIRLSRTFKLADTARIPLEQNAQVRVESNSGQAYALTPKGSGMYEAAQIAFSAAQQYRLYIRTSANKEYRSEYVPYKATPVIDSINWRRNNEGIQVYANAHDDQSKTTYYRWNYDETWELHSAYFSTLDYKNHMIVQRDPTVNIFYCWSSALSSRILLGSSARLQKDVIHLQPLVLVPNASEKLGVRYSIQVRQYALTEQAYQYWLNMQKNTENLGSIFDPQPSEMSGNIRCISNPAELVIGFVSAGTVQSRRIFINNSDVNSWGYSTGCEQYFVPNNRDSLETFLGGGGNAPIMEAMSPDLKPGYSYSTIGCVDCRLRGTNIKPSFW